MECQLFEILIQKYYDGELDPAERARYESHRSECERCRKLDADYALVFDGLNDMEVYQPSPDFKRRVLASVDISRYRVSLAGRMARRFQFIWQQIPSPARLAGVLVLFFVIFLTVFRPALSAIIGWSRVLLGVSGSAVVAVNKLAERVPIIISNLISVESYKAAGGTLLDAARQIITESPVFIATLSVAVILVIVFVSLARAHLIRKKGEDHASTV